MVPDSIAERSFSDSDDQVILSTLKGIFAELKNYQPDYKKIIQFKLQHGSDE